MSITDGKTGIKQISRFFSLSYQVQYFLVQVKRLLNFCKTFENNLSNNIKLLRTQISKI